MEPSVLNQRPNGATTPYPFVDGLSMPVPERRWFEEFHEARLACVNTTVAVWENAGETMAILGK